MLLFADDVPAIWSCWTKLSDDVTLYNIAAVTSLTGDITANISQDKNKRCSKKTNTSLFAIFLILLCNPIVQSTLSAFQCNPHMDIWPKKWVKTHLNMPKSKTPKVRSKSEKICSKLFLLKAFNTRLSLLLIFASVWSVKIYSLLLFRIDTASELNKESLQNESCDTSHPQRITTANFFCKLYIRTIVSQLLMGIYWPDLISM